MKKKKNLHSENAFQKDCFIFVVVFMVLLCSGSKNTLPTREPQSKIILQIIVLHIKLSKGI